MKILLTVLVPLMLCACANDPSSKQLIEVGESCAAIGKGIQVSSSENSQQPYFWNAYRQSDAQVKCR